MLHPRQSDQSTPAKNQMATADRRIQKQDSVEDDPAVDRGERIATGKGIARGGHESGRVPGAEELPSSTAASTESQ